MRSHCPTCNSDSPEYHPGESINGPCPDRWHIANIVIDVDEAGPGLVHDPYAVMLAAVEWGARYVVVNEMGHSYEQVLTQAEATRRYVSADCDPPLRPGSLFVEPLVPTTSYTPERPEGKPGTVHVENLLPCTDEQWAAAAAAGWNIAP